MEKAYKFRALTNLEHVADIFCNTRFYAAQFFELNDPMEGIYNFEEGTKAEYINKIDKEKKKLRICSFSYDFHNVLLWAHYADGFNGICIEVELNNWPDSEVAKVNYEPFSPIFNDSHGQYAHFWPRIIFREKNSAWKYEKEVRVLTNQEYVSQPVVEIKAVLLGSRTSEAVRKALFRIVPDGVRIWETEISKKTNNVIKTKQIRRVKK